jgi:phage terminase Nu1 subunit (DNA packaging protein)
MLTNISELNRQELLAALKISDSTLRRWGGGVPSTPVGKKKRIYNLAEVKAWLRERDKTCPSGQTGKVDYTSASCSAGDAFIAAFQKVRLRVMPSPLKQN